MMNITSHSLAKLLLALPDLPIRVDGIGEEVGLACEPNMGQIFGQETPVVVLEIVTKEQEDKEKLFIQREAGRGVYWDKGNEV